jgi:hypothetical protein
LAAGVDEYVGRLEIAVNDSRFVGMMERIGDRCTSHRRFAN